MQINGGKIECAKSEYNRTIPSSAYYLENQKIYRDTSYVGDIETYTKDNANYYGYGVKYQTSYSNEPFAYYEFGLLVSLDGSINFVETLPVSELEYLGANLIGFSPVAER